MLPMNRGRKRVFFVKLDEPTHFSQFRVVFQCQERIYTLLSVEGLRGRQLAPALPGRGPRQRGNGRRKVETSERLAFK